MATSDDRKDCRLLPTNHKLDNVVRKAYAMNGERFGMNDWEAVERFPKVSRGDWGSSNSISSCMTRVSLDYNSNRYESVREDDGLLKKNSVDSFVTIEADGKQVDGKPIVNETSKLVIFDYDDTILPTCSLTLHKAGLNNNKIGEDVKSELDKLSSAILENFETAMKVGTVVIVTNASSEWLSQSCERYLPRVAEFLIEKKVRIISARDRFGNSLLAQKHWKYFIFIDLIEEQFIRQLKSGEPFSVISIGDGTEEREACMKLVGIFKNQGWTFKNLKFLSQPSYGCLTLQHLLLQKSFKNFVDMDSSADLCIQFDKNQR